MRPLIAVQLLFGVMASAAPHVGAGKIRVLAINGGKRYNRMPDVPTVDEVIPGYERPPGWMAYFAPAGLPQPITRRLFNEIGKAMQQPEVISIYDKVGFLVETSESPERFAAEVKRHYERAGALVKAAGIQPEQ